MWELYIYCGDISIEKKVLYLKKNLIKIKSVSKLVGKRGKKDLLNVCFLVFC